jgi:hypothetical protein
LSRLLDGDDVERLNHRVARQQVAGDLAERLRDGPVDVRGPRVIGLERVKDPVAVLADLERVPGDRALLGDSELAPARRNSASSFAFPGLASSVARNPSLTPMMNRP